MAKAQVLVTAFIGLLLMVVQCGQAAAAATLFVDPVSPSYFEYPSEALTVWREHTSGKPALLLFSDTPCLAPLPEDIRVESLSLLKLGRRDELLRRSHFFRADPAILPQQAVRAALMGGLLSELIWVVPTSAGIEKMSLAPLRKQLLDKGHLTPAEADALVLNNGVATGRVAGLPFRAVHANVLATIKLDQPAIAHFDLSYFRGFYRSEMATPLFPLIYDQARQLRSQRIGIVVATLSYSTRDAFVGLDARFALTAFAELMHSPKMLDQGLPTSWSKQAEAMYLAGLFQESQTTQLLEQALADAPHDPGLLYALSQRRFFEKKLGEGQALLAKAVAIDPGYGRAYIDFADRAIAAGDLKGSIRMLEKAARAFPEDPLLALQLAELLVRTGQKREALVLVDDLQKLAWSPIYYPDVPAALEQLAKAAQGGVGSGMQ